MNRKRLVASDRSFVIKEGRVRDPVKPLVLIKDRDRSVSVIRTLPLAVNKTYVRFVAASQFCLRNRWIPDFLRHFHENRAGGGER